MPLESETEDQGDYIIPVVRDRSRESSVRLGRHLVVDIIPVTDRAQELDTAIVRSFQNRVSKLPNSTILVRLQIRDTGEVVDEDGTQQPTTTTQTREVGGRLQQSTQMALRGRVLRTAIECFGSTGSVQHGTVTTSRNRNTDVGDVGGVAGDAIKVSSRIKVGNRDMTEEIPHRRQGLFAPSIQPRRLIFRETSCSAHCRTAGRAVHGGGRITIGSIGERATGIRGDSEVRCDFGSGRCAYIDDPKSKLVKVKMFNSHA